LGSIFVYQHFRNNKERTNTKAPIFLHATYLIDATYVEHHFPEMGWEWNPSLFPIHDYCFQLWEDNDKKNLYDICEHFLVPLDTIIYKHTPLRISKKSMHTIK
jgi:hypothetical protein